MYCRHLLLNTMVPSASQRLMGLATSATPVSLGQTQRWSSSSSPSNPSGRLDSDVNCSVISCVPHNRMLTLPVGPRKNLTPRLTSMRSLNSKTLLTRNQLYPSQLSHFHHVSRNDWDGAHSQIQPLHHPLLGNGTQCSLGASARRRFSLSPKAILEASPPAFQPYLRLIRFDKPIGECIFTSFI